MWLAAVPILGAEGLDWLAARPAKRRLFLGTILPLVMLAAGAMGIYILVHGRYQPPIAMARHAVAHLVAVAAVGRAIVVLILPRLVPRRVGMLAIALIGLAEILVLDRGYVQPRPSDWAEGHGALHGRRLAARPASRNRFLPAADGPFRLLNLGMTYNLEGASGYSSMQIWHYANLIWAINHGAPYPKKTMEDDLAASVIRRFDSPLVDLLNIRWLIGPRAPSPKWIERFRPNPGEPIHAVHEASLGPAVECLRKPRRDAARVRRLRRQGRAE